MADKELLGLAADYYEHRTQKRLTAEQRDKLGAMLDSGLTAAHVMDGVDLAVSRFGFTGTANDYWQTVLADCRNTYKILKKQGMLDAEKAAK